MTFGNDIFNHPFRITLIQVTRGGVNQNTGKPVGNTESETDITGAIDVLTREEDSKEDRDRSGPTPVGMAALYTSNTQVKVGDRLRVYYDTGETISKTYYVKGLESRYPFFNDGRLKFQLELEQGQVDNAF